MEGNTTRVCGMSVPLEAVAVCWTIIETKSCAIELFCVVGFVFFSSRRVFPVRKKWWTLTPFNFDERPVVVIILLLAFLGLALGCKHDNDVFMNFVYRTFKSVKGGANFLILNGGWAHKIWTYGNVSFFEWIDLVPNPLCPNFRLRNLRVNIECVLDSLRLF